MARYRDWILLHLAVVLTGAAGVVALTLALAVIARWL
jgi:hypothetical protein